MWQVNVLPTVPFLVLPEVSSERREYVPVGWLEPVRHPPRGRSSDRGRDRERPPGFRVWSGNGACVLITRCRRRRRGVSPGSFVRAGRLHSLAVAVGDAAGDALNDPLAVDVR